MVGTSLTLLCPPYGTDHSSVMAGLVPAIHVFLP
jgi:hypothetical protein